MSLDPKLGLTPEVADRVPKLAALLKARALSAAQEDYLVRAVARETKTPVKVVRYVVSLAKPSCQWRSL